MAGRKRGRRNSRVSTTMARQQRKGVSQPRPVVVVQTNQPRRKTGRRRGVGKQKSGTTNTAKTIREFVTDPIAGNGAGYIVMGPDNTQAGWLKGFLQAYHHYIIKSVSLEWHSAASSTASGVMSYEWDTTCTTTGVNTPMTNSIKITNNGTRSASGKTIAVEPQYESGTQNQFRIGYKGTGATGTAGFFKVRFTLLQNNPK